MITRVTHQSTQRTSLANLQANLSKMSDLQARASSGKLITKASDDPAKTADAMALRKEQRASTQYARNAQDGVSWLTAADTAMSTSLGFLNRARNLVVQGSNTGALGPEGREALAVELEGISKALAAQANTTFLGRSIFAGTADGPAFTETTPGVYEFTDPKGIVERRVGAGTTVRVDTDGGKVFGTNSDPAGVDPTIFAVLTDVADKLRKNEDVSGALATIDTRLSGMLSQAASIGARTNQLTSAQENLTNKIMTLKSDISGVEDIDLPLTIIELQMQEVAYKAALGATARVLQPSLMDYLR
ncbi:flagellar hook-associated protein 3 FlgL [Sanguibacter gelidistatuariae]|uniref:Flagellar hook-associated protein 3 FlgL n=1 Tax=Sanguibacter gelidistatuariae TaxID=1814289 RepID=A0A1G6PV59_9MICO|nr:flagellar hook-associated protein FlgL [Sanguibacter gelidistatuariae]SDC83928.1 flagellar hook-associated protein 3 FlgL [Sanguibacter gelidistatuariae]